jgi:alkylhydroperoxidase/carboxymuconolactone decarboxylase family protein YurZ
MKIRKKLFADFEYEEVLDLKTRELIRVGCAVAVGCPT